MTSMPLPASNENASYITTTLWSSVKGYSTGIKNHGAPLSEASRMSAECDMSILSSVANDAASITEFMTGRRRTMIKTKLEMSCVLSRLLTIPQQDAFAGSFVLFVQLLLNTNAPPKHTDVLRYALDGTAKYHAGAGAPNSTTSFAMRLSHLISRPK
ncbi:hypothetical protein V8C34DRAFT_35796 [Trichoderma compactum]